jgi:hypothetical protein
MRRVRADSKEIRSRWSDANTTHPEANGDEGDEREDVGVSTTETGSRNSAPGNLYLFLGRFSRRAVV